MEKCICAGCGNEHEASVDTTSFIERLEAHRMERLKFR